MTRSTPRSAALFERSKKIVPGGVHSPVRAFRSVGGTPRFIERAQGAEMIDVDGHHYLDFCMSWGPLMFGHQDPEVAEAVHSALGRGWSYGAAEPYSLELAELITSSIPWVEKIRFVNSGTEAVMSALRVARAVTGRTRILKFDGCYHGHVDSMLVRAGSGLAEMASPDSAGVSASTAAETLVVPLNDLPALREAFDRHGRSLAAVILEPVPANNGLLLQKPEFFSEVFRLAKSHGTLVLFDEVITGFRIGFGGMAEHLGVSPDLVTYGKIIGGGFPVGAYGGKSQFMDLVAPSGPVYQAGTLSANPVAMAAGLAMLKKLKRESPYALLEQRCKKLAIAIEKKSPFSVQRYSSIFWILNSAPTTSDGAVRSPEQTPKGQKEFYSKLFHHLLELGIYLAPSGYEVSFLSTVHTDEILNRLVDAIQSI